MAVWTAGDPYVTLFGVRAAWGWLFVLPVIAVLPTVAGAVAAVRGWRRGWWSPRVRVLHGVAAVTLVAFVVVAPHGILGLLRRFAGKKGLK